MKSNIQLLIAFLCVTTLFSCRDIIEPNLTNKQMTILAPADETVSSSLSVTFWWEELDGATAYRLQVVKGTFGNIQSLVLDSNVTADKYTVQLLPGSYQWRIRAFNANSNTEFITRNLSVDSTLVLSAQTPRLTSPANNSYVANYNSVVFKWDEIPNSTQYRIDIYNMTDSVTLGDQLIQEDVATNSYTGSFSSTDGYYAWRIQARNDISLSKYSDYFYFSVKTSLPTNSVPSTAPNSLDTANTHYVKNLNWVRYGTAIAGDYVVISNDSTFPVSIYTDSVFVTATTYQIDTLYLQTLFQSYSGTPPFYFYWRLRTKDKAGNYSIYNPAVQRRRIRINR